MLSPRFAGLREDSSISAHVAPASQERNDDSFHALLGHFQRLIAVHDLNTFRLGPRQLQISFADACVKIVVFGVETIATVRAVAAALGARRRSFDRKIEDHGQIRLQPFRSQLNDFSNQLRRKAAPGPLVSPSGISITIRENNLAALQRRAQNAANVLRAIGCENEQLG